MLYLIESNNIIYGVYNDNNIIISNMKFLNIDEYKVYGFNLNNINYIDVKNLKKTNYDISQIFILKTEKEYIGLFSTLEKVKNTIDFLKKLGLNCEFNISKCSLNGLHVEEYIEPEKLTKEDIKEINNTDEKLRFEKYELNKQLNELKLYEEKMATKKKEFDTDLNLFKMFKNKMEEEKNFVIPELFENKYKLFIELEEKDELNFNNYKNYNFNNYNGKYKSLF